MTRVTSCIVLLTVFLTACNSVVAEIENETELNTLHPISRNGKIVLVSEELKKKLEHEHSTWHWTPWLRTRVEINEDGVAQQTCPAGDSIESFPDSIFTDEQLRQGAFLLYVLFGIYSFTLLAIVCNDYFIPCVELICEDLKIPQNVAAATFMAVATSCPEFFVNVISTFLTESSMGIGTIVGSAIFNALGVAAVGGLATVIPIKIERRPVTRDVIIYMINVSVLVAFVWDGQIDWYEAVVLGVLYVLYFVVMFNSVRMFALYDRLVAKWCNKNNNLEIAEMPRIENEKSIEEGVDNKGFSDTTLSNPEKVSVVDNVETEVVKPKKSVFRWPKENSNLYKFWWLYTWPLKLVLGMTIPSPISCRRWYPFAFFMCIVWIGANSYCVSWSMTVIGHTFYIPESVMGMTFLAFGGCLPEACSVFIMSRRGEGGIGVSNALGANSLAILFALGLPWLIKTLTLVAQDADEQAVLINSAGIDFVVGSLLVAVACLWITLYIGKFTLRRSLGAILLVLYAIFITFAILVEMGIILDRGIEIC
ncbi:sodium/potassium/calcium exchanger 4-like [Spodoptera frugiperda]|uniref:Sodium/potassium/calcium exchanger 4-like n=1 Tax=Spodoptera frugiperda TaxID=7108 RepID=A0A9R0CYM3_SPOFR|nr:sodium/potassium/calcium exchanger 4-like [Spodoptera frugiperda]